MTTLRRHTGVNATGTGPKLRTLTNVVNNPRAIGLTGTPGGIIFSAGTGGSATRSVILTGGPLPICPSFSRVLYSVAQTGGNLSHYNGVNGNNLVTPGKTYVLKVWVRSSIQMPMRQKVGAYNGDTYLTGANASQVIVPANTWTQLTMEYTAPANSTRLQMNVDQEAGGPYYPVGGFHDLTGWFIFEKPATGTDSTAYGDGDVAGWTWAGTPHQSQSSGFGAIA
jgi:hypothetical protein